MKFRLSSKFGALEEIRNGRVHTGIDLAIPENETLRSIADGVVEKVYDGSGPIGKGVKIEMPDGTDAIYGHMNEVTVKVGERVSFGQEIGLSGNTGHSTGAHLHFALNKDGQFVDPTTVAEQLAELSGDVSTSVIDAYEKSGFITKFLVKGATATGDTLREKVAAQTVDILYGVGQGIADFLVDASTAIALYGGGLLILAIAVGWSDGKKYLGLLLLANVLIKYLLGGV